MKVRIAASITITLTVILIIFIFLQIPSVERLRADVAVSNDNMTGFNTNTDALYFGSMASGNTGERKFFVINSKDYAASIKIGAHGEAAGWLQFIPDNFNLDKKERKEVLARMRVPADAAEGNHTAEVLIVARRKWL